MNNKKLFVGNCAFDLDDNGLRGLFESNGLAITSAQIIRDKFTDRSRGFGFVEMEKEEDVEKAVELLNGKELQGRALTVNVAREKTSRPSFPRSYESDGNSRRMGNGGRGKRW